MNAIQKYFKYRQSLIDQYAKGDMTKREYLQKNYEAVVYGDIGPFRNMDTVEKALFNYQYYNALELQKAGAAVVIEEKNLTGDGLVKTVEELLTTPGKLAEMGANAKTLGNPHSLDMITEKLLELVKP